MITPLENIAAHTEKELLEKTANGDERAFRCLFDRYQPKVYSFAMYITRSTYLSEEIVQEVFMKIWITRKGLADIEHFGAYLKTIAKNIASNYLKRLAHEQLILQKMAEEAPPSEANLENEVIMNELQRILDEAIATLPPQQQKVYLLHRYDNLKQEEIARQMQISYYTVKEHMKKALKTIRTYVEQRIDLIILVALQKFFW
jgi:RNA polymerase sigma-70 factor (ECF subfamily)